MTIKRIFNSAVIWSWITNALRAGSGLVILPLLWRKLSGSELGLSGVLLSVSTLGLMFDFGFAPTVDRFVSYAMGGAKTIEAYGPPESGEEHAPNYRLLWELLSTTRRLYLILTLVLFVVGGLAGTVLIERIIRNEHSLHPEFSVTVARLAWALTFFSILLDIYWNWWSIFLRGLNEVRLEAQLASIGALVKFTLSVGLLLCGAGLLSVPIATIVASNTQRQFARRRVLQKLPPRPDQNIDFKNRFAAMWPNSWRLGAQLASTYLLTQVNTFFCAELFHLELTGSYTYSVQLMNYAVAMASVWMWTKWPLISQYQTRRDFGKIRTVLRTRLWLQFLTFSVLGGGVIFVAPGLLHWIGKGKELLPKPWLCVLAAGSFMEMIVSTCGAIISTGNRLPYIWLGIISNILSLGTSLALLQWSSLQVESFVLAPLLCGAAFNYWYWPRYAARSIDTSISKLLFQDFPRNSRSLAKAQ